MNAVLSEEPPDLTASNDQVPLALERTVRRCQEKQPDNRFQSAKGLAFAIENTSGTSGDKGRAANVERNRQLGKLLLGAVSFALLGLVIGLVFARFRSGVPTNPSAVSATSLIPVAIFLPPLRLMESESASRRIETAPIGFG